jgi:GNAT superfamily N-acetyltransferase
VALLNALAWRWHVEVTCVSMRRMEALQPMPSVAGVDVRQLSEKEVLSHCDDLELDLSPEAVREAFACGTECVGALDAGKLVGYVWSAYADAPHLEGIRVAVPHSVVYKYKAFVRPEYRGRKVAPAMYQVADIAALRRGRRESVGFILVQNVPSLRSAQSIGSRVSGYALSWKVGRFFFVFHSRGLRRLGLRFYMPPRLARLTVPG